MDLQLNDLLELGLKYVLWPIAAGVATVAGWVFLGMARAMKTGAGVLWGQFMERIDSLNTNVVHLNDNMTKMLAWKDGQEEWKSGVEKRLDRFETIIIEHIKEKKHD